MTITIQKKHVLYAVIALIAIVGLIYLLSPNPVVVEKKILAVKNAIPNIIIQGAEQKIKEYQVEIDTLTKKNKSLQEKLDSTKGEGVTLEEQYREEKKKVLNTPELSAPVQLLTTITDKMIEKKNEALLISNNLLLNQDNIIKDLEGKFDERTIEVSQYQVKEKNCIEALDRVQIQLTKAKKWTIGAFFIGVVVGAVFIKLALK